MQKSKIGLATRRVIGGEASIGVGGRNQFGEVGCGENPIAEAVLGEAVRGKLDSWRTLLSSLRHFPSTAQPSPITYC